MSAPTETSSLTELEDLTHLNAILKESFHIGNGVAQRMPRTSHKPVQYGDYTIPAAVPLSMSIYMQHDSSVFPDPTSYKPERWLNNPKVAVGPGKEEKSLDHYLVPFSKGTRMCIGQHVEWAELYIVFATIVRRVDCGCLRRACGMWRLGESISLLCLLRGPMVFESLS